jgi:prepilin peptidase CpaA
MDIFNPSLWPLWCASLLMLIAAVVNARTYEYRVPNLLSLPAIVSGWLVALAISASVEIPTSGGGLVPSLAASAVGFFLLVPFYKKIGLGAGCVKMQMAFGAWVGCAVGLPAAVMVTALATVAGGLLTAAGATYLVLRLRSEEEVIAWSHLFPAQITLSLGSVWAVIGAVLMGWV